MKTLLAILGLVLAPLLLAEEIPKGSRLRVLIVADTYAENIGQNAVVSRDKLVEVLDEIFLDPEKPQRRFKRTMDIMGENERPTPEAILDYYRNLEVASDETLLFYYFGHGGTDQDRGHFLAMSGGDLLRSDLRDAMMNKGARHVVIVSDACSNYAPYTPRQRRVPAVWGGFENLFFQHTGLTDITAATVPEFGWSNSRHGGLFSSIFINLLCEPVETVDRNSDGFVTWTEFFTVTKEQTQALFIHTRDNAARRTDGGIDIKDYSAQTPSAFSIAGVSSVNNGFDLPPVQVARNEELAIHSVSLVYQTQMNGVRGMAVVAHTSTRNLQGLPVVYAAYFSHSNGPLLISTDGQYEERTANGSVVRAVAGGTLKREMFHNDIMIFIPYSQIELPAHYRGRKTQLEVRIVAGAALPGIPGITAMAQSDIYGFSFTKP